MTLLLKAQVKHGAAGDLFPTEVHVKGHLRTDTHGARFVLPYVGVRHKAPAKPLPEVDLPLFVVRAPPPPPPEPLLIITPEPPAPTWETIGAWIAALLAGEAGDIEAAAGALGLGGSSQGMAHVVISRLASFLDGKMPKAAIGRISVKEGMSLAEWAEAVRAEHFKPKAVIVRRGEVPKELSAAVDKARGDRDRAQAAYKDSHQDVKTDPMVRMIGGLAPSKQREAGLGLEFRAAQDKLRQAEAAIASRPVAAAKPLVVIPQAKRKAQSGKLREAADKIIAVAHESLGRDRQANTRKRVQQAASAIADAQREERIGQTMRNLADAIEAGEAKALASITSRAAVEALDEQAREARVARWRKEGQGHKQWEEIHARPIGPEDVAAATLPVPQLYRHTARELAESGAVLGVPVPAWLKEIGEDDRFRPTEAQVEELKTLIASLEPMVQKYAKDYSAQSTLRNAANHARWDIRTVRELITKRNRFAKMGINSDEDMRAALAEYIQYRGGFTRENPITKLERDLVGKRPGIDFFPTPPPLAKRMVELAGITPGMHVLEPSAGKGDIADALKAAGAKVDALEISAMLRPILEAKGHHLAGSDFMDYGVSDPAQRYDAVVMNPPWSGGADVRHVMRAWDMVKPGGRLVALMSPHASFASDNQSVQFRAWLEANGASTEKLGADAFKSQWMSNGIASWLVSVDKPATNPEDAH